MFVYVDSVDLFFCVLIFVSAVKHVSYTSCVWLVQCFGILLAVWGYSGVTRGCGGAVAPRPPRGVQQARGAKQPRLGKYFVTNEDNETA